MKIQSFETDFPCFFSIHTKLKNKIMVNKERLKKKCLVISIFHPVYVGLESDAENLVCINLNFKYFKKFVN